MPEVSIIVPIYRVESFLEGCLSSIQRQTFGDFEVICVIDGSDDGSEEIARRFAREDARFTVIVKENGGLSSARNCGIEHARGEIVVFVDADDRISPDCCERLHQVFAETGAEVVVFGFEVVSPQPPSQWFERVSSPPEAVFEGFSAELMFAEYSTPYAWRDAVRRDLFARTGLRFDEKVKYAEDVVYQFALYPQATRIVVIPDKLYRYQLDHTGSLTHSHQGGKNRLSAHLGVVEAVCAEWERLGLLDAYAPELFSWSRSFVLRGIEKLDRLEREDHLDAVVETWRRYFDEGVVDAVSVGPVERLLMQALFSEGAHSALSRRRSDDYAWGLEHEAVPEQLRRPARLAVGTLCRGEGAFYLECSIEAQSPFESLSCIAYVDGVPVPAAAYPLTSKEQGSAQNAVIVAPLLDAAVIEIAVRPDGDPSQQATCALSYRKIRWTSRMNYRLHPHRCALIRDFEESFTYRRYRLRVEARFEKGRQAIWRFQAAWIGDAAHMPELAFCDGRGMPIDAKCVLLEYKPGALSESLGENVAFLSATLPAEIDHFMAIALDGSGFEAVESIAAGFTVVDSPMAKGLKDAMCELMKSAADDDGAYNRWLVDTRAKPGELVAERCADTSRYAAISIVVFDGGSTPEALQSTLDSLKVQSYPCREIVMVGNWREGQHMPREGTAYGAPLRSVSFEQLREGGFTALGLSGDYVGFASSGDQLEPDALYRYASALCGENRGCANADALYCDEDVSTPKGAYAQPFFKSPLNVDLLYCGNWIGHFLMVRRSVVESLSLPPLAEADDWEYALSLAVYAADVAFGYVPRVLYHARRSPFLVDDARTIASRKALLQRHLDNRGVAGEVVQADVAGALRIRYELPMPHPLVSIIIPSKDHTDLLDACLRSIAELCTYDAYEIIVIENNSIEPETFAYYDRIADRYPRVRVERWPDEFNYSKIVNFGAEHANGEYYLFLNNDTEVISPSFIEEMLGCLQLPEVGVVGAKLLFKDGLLQQVGAGVGIWDAVVCFNQNRDASDGGYLEKACLPCDYAAVGGACQMTRASTFKELGGYDERLRVGFNDIDYCMRVRERGLLAVGTPYAVLYHYEFASRGREEFDDEKMLRWERERGLFIGKWPEPFASGDPYVSPNLMRNNTYYRLS